MPLMVYLTCPDLVTARKIGQILLDERLIACHNIFSGALEAGFLWKGQQEKSGEIAMIVKTMEDRFVELNKRILAIHPYETPCVIAIQIVAGNPDFLAWINDSTRPLSQV